RLGEGHLGGGVGLAATGAPASGTTMSRRSSHHARIMRPRRRAARIVSTGRRASAAGALPVCTQAATTWPMPYPPEYEDVHARYYDGAYDVLRDGADIGFYSRLARETGGPVLELGCGTGRVLLPLARAGLACTSRA